ncbi:MAG: hypothetical protein Harvfovirus1_35 [Harvfovirus sp.]|uniref:Uncharacterized protein n=1 Tax=Harvfovirus sp. TaxID=2487768 RepID=A0A3G4ZZW5_9VIRU|nr:MAG: hypothetical protein Harvfovirus1_35 [Harvfovirus sp.]
MRKLLILTSGVLNIFVTVGLLCIFMEGIKVEKSDDLIREIIREGALEWMNVFAVVCVMFYGMLMWLSVKVINKISNDKKIMLIREDKIPNDSTFEKID